MEHRKQGECENLVIAALSLQQLMKWFTGKQIQEHAQQIVCIHRQWITPGSRRRSCLAEQAWGRTRRIHRDHENIVFGADWRDQPPDEKSFVLLIECVDLVDDI